MQGVIIAAGMGNRCLPHTQDTPKCLLNIQEDRTLLDNLLEKFKRANIQKVAIVVGYCADKIVKKVEQEYPGIEIFVNNDYHNNNILHSLMFARKVFNDDLIVSYSDIWIEQDPLDRLMASTGECVLAVDENWQEAYVGRTAHPITQAEKALYDKNHIVYGLGKHLPAHDDTYAVGEFIGLFKISKAFCPIFLKVFDQLNAKLKAEDAFQFSVCWQKAYITDYFNELIAQGYDIKCSLHSRGWFEMDTEQDYLRLLKLVKDRGVHVA